MEFEDSRSALFVEPNAYLPRFESKKEPVKPIQKVQYQQPYEFAPSYETYQKNTQSSSVQSQQGSQNNFFTMPNLMSILSALGKGKSDITGIMNLFSGNKGQVKGQSNPLMSILSNKEMVGSLFNLLGSKKNSSSKGKETDIETTAYEIKNYTRV